MRGRLTPWLERRFEVRPTTGQVEPFADGLRALAVLGVVVVHSWGFGGQPRVRPFGLDVTWFIDTAGLGIVAFFMLSGYLLARPWFRAELTHAPRPNVRRFYIRRFRRLAPAYYVAILVIVPVFLYLGDIGVNTLTGATGALNIASHATFTHLLSRPGAREFGDTMSAVWSLTPEAIFYIVLPFAAAAFTGRRWRFGLAGALVIELTWILLVYNVFTIHDAQWNFAVRSEFPGYALTFAIGICLARLVVLSEAGQPGERRPWWQDPHCALAAFVIGAAILLYVQYEAGTTRLTHPQDYEIAQTPATLAIAFIIYGLRFGPSFMRRPFEVIGLRFVAWISYSIFLYHVAVIKLLTVHTSVNDLTQGRRFVVLVTATLAITIAIATVSYLLVERPFLVRRGERSGGGAIRRPSRVALASAAAGFVALWAVPGLFARGIHTPFGLPSQTRLDAQLSTTVTPGQAASRNVIYSAELRLLAGCGAQRGRTEVLSAPGWGLSGSVFACRSGQDAAAAIAERVAWERSRGLQPTPVKAVGVHAFYATQAGTVAGRAGYPARLEICYASAHQVIGLVIQASTETKALDAAARMLDGATKAYPPSEDSPAEASGHPPSPA